MFCLPACIQMHILITYIMITSCYTSCYTSILGHMHAYRCTCINKRMQMHMQHLDTAGAHASI